MAIKKTKQYKKAGREDGKAVGSKALVKQMTPEELGMVKDFVEKVAYFGGEPEEVMQKIAKVLLPTIKAGKKPDKETAMGIADDFRKALMVYGLDTHFPLSETVEKEYRPQVVEFSHQLIKEYDCKTSGEKALAEVVVSAYARILKYSRHLGAATLATSVTKTHVGLYSVLSKELDRANRHFTTALTTLIQLKAPSPEINVRAKTAFVAQNQQLNVNPPNKDNPNKNEIIDPK